MGSVEHAGHGIPIIVKKYDEEVFEIEDNYIFCTVSFNSEVMSKEIKEKVSIGINLNKT